MDAGRAAGGTIRTHQRTNARTNSAVAQGVSSGAVRVLAFGCKAIAAPPTTAAAKDFIRSVLASHATDAAQAGADAGLRGNGSGGGTGGGRPRGGGGAAAPQSPVRAAVGPGVARHGRPARPAPRVGRSAGVSDAAAGSALYRADRGQRRGRRDHSTARQDSRVGGGGCRGGGGRGGWRRGNGAERPGAGSTLPGAGRMSAAGCGGDRRPATAGGEMGGQHGPRRGGWVTAAAARPGRERAPRQGRQGRQARRGREGDAAGGQWGATAATPRWLIDGATLPRDLQLPANATHVRAWLLAARSRGGVLCFKAHSASGFRFPNSCEVPNGPWVRCRLWPCKSISAFCAVSKPRSGRLGDR